MISPGVAALSKKPYKKPKHTALVVPGSGETGPKRVFKKDKAEKEQNKAEAQIEEQAQTAEPAEAVNPAKEGEAAPAQGGKEGDKDAEAKQEPSKASGETVAKVAAPAKAPQKAGQKKSNTIALPNPKDHPVRRKARFRKNLRRVRNLAVLLLVVCLVAFFATGAYMPVWISLSESVLNARLGMQKGNGFPMEFAIAGFSDTQSMGDNGFVVLGDKDIAIVSETGRESYRGQHGFVNARITASPNRVCAYSRRGRTYTVYDREGIFYEGSTDNDIQFAQMSDGGWLMLCTAGRSRYEVSLYSPTMTGDFSFRWSSSDYIPLRAAFTGDRTLALGCVSASGGAMGSTVYIFQTNRSESRAQQAAIQVEAAVPLQMHFLASSRLLVIYDNGYAAVYNGSGEEVARYDYGGRQPYAADVDGNRVVLLFGAEAQAGAHLVVLDTNLNTLGSAIIQSASDVQILAADGAIYVMQGQEVQAYGQDGALLGTLLLEGKPYGLVWGGAPLALSAEGVQDVRILAEPTPQTDDSSTAPPGSSASATDQSVQTSVSIPA